MDWKIESAAAKSILTARVITRHRRDRNRVLNKPKTQLKCHEDVQEKENLPPIFAPNARKHYQKSEMHIFGPKNSDHTLGNPFTVPLEQRIFNTEVLKRHEKPIKIVEDEVKAVTTHIHNEFFTVVEGRPVRPNANIKDFMRNIRNILLFRANTAYLKDQILNIETLLSLDELNLYNESLKLYKDTIINFEKFLKEGYDNATLAMQMAYDLEEKIQEINKDFEIVNYDYCVVESRIIVLSDRFDVLLLYRKFLDKVSPLGWRIEHGLEGKTEYYKKLFLEEEPQEAYMAAKSTAAVVTDLKCVLYFKHPKEIMHLYDDIALQCRRYIEINMHNDRVMKPIIQINKRIRKKQIAERNEMEFMIQSIEMHIAWYEKKEKLYRKKFFTILNEQFKELISSKTSMKLFSSVQDVHSKLLGDVADLNDTLPNLMRDIELIFNQYMLLLDFLDLDVVKKVSHEILHRDRENMKNAYAAQRELKEWANFERALKISFQPTHLFKRKLYVPKIKQRFDHARSSFDVGKAATSSTMNTEEDVWSEDSDDGRVVGAVASKSKEKSKSAHSRMSMKPVATTSQITNLGISASKTVKPKAKSSGKSKKDARKSHAKATKTGKLNKDQKQKKRV